MEKEDLKLLYMTYVTDFLSLGRMEEDKVKKSISPTLMICFIFIVLIFA